MKKLKEFLLLWLSVLVGELGPILIAVLGMGVAFALILAWLFQAIGH